MTDRHNMVQNRIQETVRKQRKIKDEDFRNNQTVSLEKFEKLKNIDTRTYGPLRPDLQYCVKLGNEGKSKDICKLFIVEFAIPFGRKVDDECQNSLEKMRIVKTNKYSSLVNF
jgi:hypothetical protein